MIIAVDAGMLGAGDEGLKVGVWRVAANLLMALGRLDKKNTYRLYSFAPIPQDLMEKFGPQMENRVITPGTGWMSVRLPLEFILRPPDVFLGLAQALPRWTGKKIGFIYDLGFISHPGAYPDSRRKLTANTRKTIRRASQIITISHATKKEIQDHYHLPSGNIAVAYPGVSAPFAKAKTARAARHPYFLLAGALKRGKNVSAALQAFAVFKKETGLAHELVLIGSDYWMDPEIKKTIKELELQDSVKVLGFVSDEKLASYYQRATALLVPSLIEGFCLPAAEAMACGTPVIASRVGSLPEVIGNGGVLISPGDIAGFARAMKKIAEDAKYRKRLSEAALVQASAYRWERFARTILSTIHHV